MVIESIELKNYRNYEELHMELNQGTNILYGDNAQGKTNILEAIYLSGTTKSHRGTKDRDMIQFGHDESHIETVIEKNNVEFKIDMHLKKNSPKGIAINKMPIRKASELFGVIHLVFFSPGQRAVWIGEYGILFPGGLKYYQKRTFRTKKIHRS